MAAYEARVSRGAGGWVGIDLDLDGEHLFRMRRQADLVESAGEAHESTVNGAVFAHPQVDPVALRRQLGTDGLQMAAQVVARRLAFQGEVEVFGIARQAEQEAQAGSPLKGQRRHGPGTLKRPKNPRLEVLAGDIAATQRLVTSNELSEMVLHTAS